MAQGHIQAYSTIYDVGQSSMRFRRSYFEWYNLPLNTSPPGGGDGIAGDLYADDNDEKVYIKWTSGWTQISK